MISELPPWIAYCHNEDVNAAFFVHKYWNIWVEPKNAAYCINVGHPFSIKNELVSNIENLFLKSSGNLAMTGNYPSEYQIKWKIDTVHLYIREVPRQWLNIVHWIDILNVCSSSSLCIWPWVTVLVILIVWSGRMSFLLPTTERRSSTSFSMIDIICCINGQNCRLDKCKKKNIIYLEKSHCRLKWFFSW